MPWRPPPSDRFYRFLVRTGLFLRWALQVRIIPSGMGSICPPPDRVTVLPAPWSREAGAAIAASGHVVVGYAERSGAYDDERETLLLRGLLQAGVDRCIADFPLAPEPGAWWMPSHPGGGAPSEAERQALDARDADRGRRRGRRST